MDIIQFLGRLHPLVLHLPIGILVLAFLMECVSRKEKYKGLKLAISFVLLVGMCTAVAAAISGYVLSLEGGYEETTLSRHKWFGIATALLAVLVYFFQQQRNKSIGGKLYVFLFSMLMFLIGITGHLGGSLTHGSDFLTEPFFKEVEKNELSINNIDSVLVFQDLIQPIFKQKCVNCHNESKIKGELLLTTVEGIKKGGKLGAFLVKGDIENSLFLQRAHLPLADKKHMPPKGKKQLTENEIALMEWWVDKGAQFNKKVGDIDQPTNIKTILAKYTRHNKSVFALQIEPLSQSVIQKIKRAGISVEQLAKDQPFVKVSLRGRNDLSQQTFDQLKKISEQLIELDLSKTNITDDMLSLLDQFPHLRKLSLQQTKITGRNFDILYQLKYLEYLNLYETPLEDYALEAIKKIASLKNLFLWQTKLSSNEIEALKNARPLLQISTGVDQSIFGSAQLKPPIINVEKDIFSDSLEVTFEINLKDVNLYYTTDGTPPDSTSQQYIDPLQLTETAHIKVITQKEGWETSEPAEKTVVRAKYKPIDIQLNQPPNDKYKADGAPSLINLKKGTTEFTAGEWLGYQKKNMTATLDLGGSVPVSNISISALEDTNSYIFFPKNITVSVSKDGKKYELVADKTIPTTKEPAPSSLQNFILNFQQQEVRFGTGCTLLDFYR